MTSFEQIGISKKEKPYVICEIAQAHDGSLGLAHSMIESVSKTGANAIKFQMHIASEESTYDEAFRINFSFEDKCRYDYWSRTSFDYQQWVGLKEHCDELDLEFICSPFSVSAVEALERLNIRILKIGSGEILNEEILSAVGLTKKPTIISTGLHEWEDINHARGKLINMGCDLAILQCTSKYPTKLEDIGINVMEEIFDRYDCLSGLSDHSGLLAPSLFAIAKGANIIEVHGTYDRSMFGPDSSSSLTFNEIKELCKYRDQFYILKTNNLDKKESVKSRLDVREMFGRSIALKKDLPKGHILGPEDMTLKKPGSGIPHRKITDIIGRKLRKDVNSSRLLRYEDIC